MPRVRLSQSERKTVPVDVDLAALFFSTQRFDQTEQRLSSVQKFLRRTGGIQRFHRFLTRIDPEQKLVVGNRRSAEAAPNLFKGRIGRCPTFHSFARLRLKILSFTSGSMRSGASLPQSPSAYWMT